MVRVDPYMMFNLGNEAVYRNRNQVGGKRLTVELNKPNKVFSEVNKFG